MSVVAAAGTHVLADLHGVAAALLRDAVRLDELLRAAASAAGARVLGSHFHGFGEGAGVTGVILLAESHLSIHTWPDEGFAALDIFMCGSASPTRALEQLLVSLAPTAHDRTTVARGSIAVRHVPAHATEALDAQHSGDRLKQ